MQGSFQLFYLLQSFYSPYLKTLKDELKIRVVLLLVHIVFTGVNVHLNPGAQKQANSECMKMWIFFASEPLCRLLTVCTYTDYLANKRQEVSQRENNNNSEY